MRIQDTNAILNEARVQRKAHQMELRNSKRNWFSNTMKRVSGSFRGRGKQSGIVGAVAAAVGVGAYLLTKRRDSFSFSSH